MRKVFFLVFGLMAVELLWSFPTQSEIKNAVAVVGSLVDADIARANAGKSNRADVAAKMRQLVGVAETDAAKWLLLKYAFVQYAKGCDYDDAAEVMDEIMSQFPDIPNATALSLINNYATRMRPDNAAKLLKYRDFFVMRKKCAAVLTSSKSTPQRKAEARCLMGNWKEGLGAFAKLGGEVGSVAANELASDKPSIAAANFWWSYKSTLDGTGGFRAHAVEIYQKCLADDSLTGLYRKMAEQRVAESKSAASQTAAAPVNDRIPLGLIHRWSFNGDIKDSIGDADAILEGTTVVENGQCVARNGYFRVPKAVPNPGDDFTIELWTTENERVAGGRVIKLFSCNKSTGWYDLGWCTGAGKAGDFYVNYKFSSQDTDCTGFNLNEETYIAITCKNIGGVKGYEVTGYKYIPKTGKLSFYKAFQGANEMKPFENLEFGVSVWPKKYNYQHSRSTFNECRVWSRCLSKDEILKSAKAGPDKLAL